MATFTPPTITEVPPAGVPDQDRLGARLFRYYKSRLRGVTIYKMADGSYRSSRPVAGVTQGSGGTVVVAEPYPPVPEGQVVNDAHAWSFYSSTATQVPLDQPTVSVVYYGGHSYQVSSVEAAALSSAGFGGYLS